MTARQAFHNTLAVLAAVALTVVLVAAHQVIIALFAAVIIASALRPLVLRLERFHIPRGMAVLVVYSVLGTAALVIVVGLLPPMLNQFASYLQNDARLASRVISAQTFLQSRAEDITGREVQLGLDPDEIRDRVAVMAEEIRESAPNLVDDVLIYIGGLVLTMVMGYYWITWRDQAVDFVTQLVSFGWREQTRLIISEIEVRFGAYFRGIALVSLTVGGLGFAGLTLLGVPNAGVIALLYAVATTIPIIGGLIGVALGTGVALLSSPTDAAAAFAVTLALEQFETYILSPRVMSEQVESNPILIIIFVSAGFTLNGLIGAFLAVPIVGMLQILLTYLVLEPRKARVASENVHEGMLLTPSKPTETA